MKKKHIKVVFFDAGGVVFDDAWHHMLDYYATALDVSQLLCERALIDFLPQWQKGMITEHELWKELSQQLGTSVIPKEGTWLEGYQPHFRIRKPVIDHISSLQERNIKTGILSNIEIPIMNFIHPHIHHYFDMHIYSCVVGHHKPDREIFDHAIRLSGVSTGEILFVDDRLENIQSANQIGIKTIHATTEIDILTQLQRKL